MARRLALIRHAKAADGPVDIDRPLSPRGVRDARALGEWLADAQVAPDRVVVSPARRARQTWDGAAAQLRGAPVPVVDDRIYTNEVALLLELVRELPDGVATLVLVGHNPSFGRLAYDLDDGTGDHAAREEMAAGFPTAAVALFDVHDGWSALSRGGAVLTAFAAPRG